MTIGEGIKQAREAKGIKQKKLAEILEVNYTTISRWEKGEREPRVGEIQKLAVALDISVSDLLGEPRPATPTGHTEARLNQLMEECGELISASARYRRHLKGDKTLNEKYTERKLIKDITEEMADVTLVMSDIRRALGVSEEEMYEVINAKMKRTEGLNGN